MSLIVTSSTQEDYEVSNGRTAENTYADVTVAHNIQRPYQYHQHINPPLIIKKNSEIAVQSVKLYRKAVFSIPQDSTYSWYLGEAIDNGAHGVDGTEAYASEGMNYQERSLSGTQLREDGKTYYVGTTSIPMPIYIARGYYTSAEMADELDRGLKACLSHPDYWHQCGVGEQEDASEAGTGWWWSVCTQGNNALLDRVQTGSLTTDCYSKVYGEPQRPTVMNSSITTVVDDPADDMRWEGDDARLTKVSAYQTWETSSAVAYTYPVSLVNGNTQFGVGGASSGEGWRVGFTRPVFPDPDGVRESPPYYGEDQRNVDFGDYYVEWSQRGTESEMTLKLRHAVWDADKNCLVMMDIDYWEADALSGTPASQLTESSFTPGAYVDKVTWQFVGEDSIIKVVMDDTFTEYVLADTTALQNQSPTVYADKRYNPKPTGQTTWTMYPMMAVLTATNYITIDTYAGIMNGTFPPTVTNRGTDSDYNEPPNAVVYEGLPANTRYYPYMNDNTPSGNGASYYGRCFGNKQVLDGCINIDSRLCYQPLRTDIEQKVYAPLKTETSTAIAPWYSNAIIPVPTNNGWDTSVIGDYTCHTDDMSLMLGFEGRSSVVQGQAGMTWTLDDDVTELPYPQWSSAWWTVPSFSLPILHASSLFIQIPDLTHESFNMCKGIPSKILYHIPRFPQVSTQNGRVGAGELFFEPNEKTYLDLNNPNDITMNDLTVELVTKDQRWAKDLGNSTTVVFHIRQKR